MQTNICSLSFALLFSVGFYNDRALMSPDAEDEQSDDTDNLHITTEQHIPSIPSTPNADQTLLPTTYGGWTDSDIEVTATPEVPQSDVTTILTYAAPAIILVLLIPLIIFLVRKSKRRKKDKEDCDIQDCTEHQDVPTSEDVKSPIFEEDTPSVMEIEMDDLDKWMSYMKNGGSRLSVLEEEKHFTQVL
ncbi:transmembrane protein 154 isoform X1 [Mixophyes fleayi]|uniref:transmembrane protein 154 isoform X1 n=1 Tax=Mixophyes fleayi TaxID=3061075 RepID=UPI003F4DC395